MAKAKKLRRFEFWIEDTHPNTCYVVVEAESKAKAEAIVYNEEDGGIDAIAYEEEKPEGVVSVEWEDGLHQPLLDIVKVRELKE